MVHKTDSQAKQEIKRVTERSQQQIINTKRDYISKIDEMEERMLNASSESETSRR